MASRRNQGPFSFIMTLICHRRQFSKNLSLVQLLSYPSRPTERSGTLNDIVHAFRKSMNHLYYFQFLNSNKSYSCFVIFFIASNHYIKKYFFLNIMKRKKKLILFHYIILDCLMLYSY